ncbi:hypothetical protein FACS189450_13500 [Spirochaetia bacterium]|nr:hypothetical protein FACS189450_13500 [Spirochaetia bacterium]
MKGTKGLFRLGAIALALSLIVLTGCPPAGGTQYTVTYSAGNGSGSAPASQTVDAGTAINLPAQGNMMAPSGQIFDGWRDGGGTAYTAGESYTVDANVKFTAQWTTGGGGTQYTVTYNVGNGTGSAPANQTVAAGTAINLPAQGSMTAPSGQTFNGWEDDGGVAYNAGANYTVNDNVTFTAQWTTGGGGIQYTVTYNVGNGTGSAPANQTVPAGTAINLPTQGSMTAPSGQTFNGWEDDGGVAYNAGANYTVNDNVTFTAQWTTGGGGITKPSAPTGVTATALSSSSIRVSWNAAAEATSYKVYYGTSSSAITTLAYTVTSGTSYTHTGLQASTTYYYRVMAVNSAGESDYSSFDYATTSSGVTVPSAPTGVTAAAQSTSSIRVSWNAAAGATSYTVWYGLGGTLSNTVTATTSPATVSGLNANTTYVFIVTAHNSAGRSPDSTSASATTQSAAPTKLATPTGLSTYVGGTFIQISWDEVPLAYTYEVYRSTSASGIYSQITVSIGTSGSSVIATDSSPRSGYNYYKVKAIPLSYLTSYTASDLSAYVSANK